MYKLIIFLHRKIRILVYQILSNNTTTSNLKRIQPVQLLGAGDINIIGKVTIGYFPSPHFFSTYAYLEARGKNSFIEIGDNTIINNGFVAIADKTSITIGENCLIGTQVEIYDSDFHALNAKNRKEENIYHPSPVKIGNNVFIGSNVRILKGVSIGDNCVIANNSVVTKDIPCSCIAGGIPAVVINQINLS